MKLWTHESGRKIRKFSDYRKKRSFQKHLSAAVRYLYFHIATWEFEFIFSIFICFSSFETFSGFVSILNYWKPAYFMPWHISKLNPLRKVNWYRLTVHIYFVGNYCSCIEWYLVMIVSLFTFSYSLYMCMCSAHMNIV